MRQVLVNPLSGYYMHGDVFGRQGDFITSPEISQTFGELAGVWYLTEWMRLGKPAKTQFVEFGPGRGTLMSDILRALSRFPYFYETITDVHLIEASPGLRKMQRATLVEGSSDADVTRLAGDKDTFPVETITRPDGVKVNWHDGIEVIPDQWSFVMAHEFFDALPVHSFEKTEEGWREMLVDIDDTDESWSVMEKMAQLVQRNGGAGLIIDYGQDHIQGDTLRAIRKHRIVHPMSDPGSADLSVDVDFDMLKQVVAKTQGMAAFGPVTQSQFLQSLGIQLRLEMLLKNAKTPESRKNMIQGVQRLLDPEQMGRIYKVLAFAHTTESAQSPPVGF
ncbi:S-adenosyl-L-methionine-dependent methyltransferase [Radiomyces spectabilis]|uniref:S-adenosyl-L-methionine-dependent methyltransferase n=1 Tax=Radiomyces spectabilis TaxID=64574 RepID=UPI00221FDC2F|nr:S-adenosyl-L-methionine-dependent methyltransferase [Radiomyces spectabilis]KAI8370664.1 S-adenosyl-L-methionine-dependent methyltransferase [Radiomyces spectabilis]